MRPKHVPLRTCVACRTQAPKSELARVVRTPGGEVLVEPSRRVHGRGAYLCRSVECWTAGLERGRLAHALKGPIPAATRASLLARARAGFGND